MGDWHRDQLATKMLVCSWTVRELLSRIDAVENDKELSSEDKFTQIKIIREEMNKVSVEIDNIKRELKLIDAYDVN